jgi:hypothetical protein
MKLNSPWTLGDDRASFDLGQWSGRFDLAKPMAGLSIAHKNLATINGLLAIEFDRPHDPFLKDCYVRQGDLIVAYPQRENRQFSLQLDYRIIESSKEQLLIELWVSIQTYLLDSRPKVKVVCPGVDAPAETSNPIVGSVGNFSFSWFIHPRDQGDSKLTVDKISGHVSAQLFGHFMEKGVIRRARLRCLVGLASLSQAAIDNAQTQFAASPLPLTA